LNEGYVATVIGGVAGAVLAVLIVAGLAMTLAPSDNEQCDDVECFVDQSLLPLVAQAAHVTMSIGSAVGTWLALRLRNQHKARRTAVLVGALYLGSGYALAFLAIILLIIGLLVPAGSTASAIAIGLMLSAASLAVLVGCPIAARYLVER